MNIQFVIIFTILSFSVININHYVTLIIIICYILIEFIGMTRYYDTGNIFT